MRNLLRALYERLRPAPLKNPDNFGIMNEIQDAIDKEHVEHVRMLIDAHPEAANDFQKHWLEQRLKPRD